MTTITLIKTIPASYLYSGSGPTTISLQSFNKMMITSKNDQLKVQIPKTKSNQNAFPNAYFNNMVIDLKKVTQTLSFSGWLEDDATQTAWNKYWKLVAMQTRGGPLTSLTIGTAVPMAFPSSLPAVYPTTTPQAFITSIQGNIDSDDTGDITANFSAKPARIKVDLEIYLGYER
jgi:hypothetical protein